MRFYFDENFPPALANGLREFQAGRRSEGVEVFHLTDEFPRGTPDEEWIPRLAQKHAVVITQDKNIHRVKAQVELCRVHKLGIVFLRPPKKTGYTYWQMVGEIMKHWTAIKEAATNEERPFSFELTPRSSRLERL